MGYEYSAISCHLEDHIMLVKLNRPEVMNALNETVFAELEDAFNRMRTDKDIKVVVITGEGEKSFASGTDITKSASISHSRANCRPKSLLAL